MIGSASLTAIAFRSFAASDGRTLTTTIATIDDRLAYDRFRIEQLVRPVVNLYRVVPLAARDAPAGPSVAFVRQKRFAFKEDLRVFADEDEHEELFRIKARQVLDVRSRLDVTAATGDRIGSLEKLFRASLLRSSWRVLGPDEAELAVARERSVRIALLRRAIDFVPYGEAVPIVYHFTITDGDRELGSLERRWGARDRYELDLSGDPERRLDRRLAIGLALALDALQGR